MRLLVAFTHSLGQPASQSDLNPNSTQELWGRKSVLRAGGRGSAQTLFPRETRLLHSLTPHTSCSADLFMTLFGIFPAFPICSCFFSPHHIAGYSNAVYFQKKNKKKNKFRCSRIWNLNSAEAKYHRLIKTSAENVFFRLALKLRG